MNKASGSKKLSNVNYRITYADIAVSIEGTAQAAYEDTITLHYVHWDLLRANQPPDSKT